MDTVKISDVYVEDRLRKEMGDIDALANSIREFGLIQPIVLSLDFVSNGSHEVREVTKLIAGGRRLAAVKRLNWTELAHGRDFIWRRELTLKEGSQELKLRQQSVELEENLKRKDLSWVEQVEGKQRLLDLMQSIYGPARTGAPTKSERVGTVTPGFGVNKLAAMLGENKALTSKDLELARIIEAVPALKTAQTKESARRQALIIGAVASMKQNARSASEAKQHQLRWTLYEGDFNDNIGKIADSSVDLVFTDLPFGVSLSQMSKHAKGLVEYTDSRASIVSNLASIAIESFRILYDNRFAIFFFGFNYYRELVDALERAGFAVNLVPLVWYKHTRSTENPNQRYANAYDPAIVAMKGSPVFMKPGQTNVVDIPALTPSNKLQIAQQPVALPQTFIEDMTAKDAMVVDLCAGSGTTGEAALRSGRRVILFEREAAACTLIRARLGAL